MSAELDIPGAAYKAAQDAIDRHAVEHNGQRVAGKGAVALVTRVTAPLVVAAELRRIADEPGMGFMTGPHDVSAATRLRARADELDPPATEKG